ncbi:MAG: ATP-binding protein [Prevotellaceae bacterium]|nr:ATP-binding protein [Prevotellaceae bacterium]
MSEVKMLPYGIANFEDLRRQNRYCVDKTMYIPKMEEAGNFLFLIRPRRFGKSIFLSMLRAYYDISSQSKFDELFGGMWIAEHPTVERGKYQVIYFDFSQASGTGDLAENFNRYCSIMLNAFAQQYESFYDEGFRQKVEAFGRDSSGQLIYICNQAKIKGYKLYLIIDEYDNFTNNVLNERGQEVYHALTHATGFYREVFKIYKANFSRILMMGVSPVTLDDLTSGFNIALNISTESTFNMMLGFSEDDVRAMLQYYKDAGLLKADIDAMITEMKPWYNNYCFAKDCLETDPKMFNCDMVVYYVRHYLQHGTSPEQMLDVNTRTDYTKMKKLIELDGMGDDQRSIIREIAAEGKIAARLNLSFPAECIFDEENFISLLYYYGMLTMTGTHGTRLVLSIPNNNVRKQYYEYLLQEYQRSFRLNMMSLEDVYYDMAFKGQWRSAMQMITDAYGKTSSVRSGIEGERNLQGFFTAYLSINSYYLTAPEVELNHGYCDLFLMPDHMRYPQTAHSYIIELKYLGAKATDAQKESQWQEAVEQIHRYAEGERVRQMCNGTELHLLVVQMQDNELVKMEEV